MSFEFRRGLPRRSASVLESLLDNLEIGVAHAERDGRILYANRHFAEILGKSIRGVSGGNLKQFIAAAIKRGTEELVEGTMNVATDGFSPERVIRLSFSPLVVGNARTVEIVATEVTELVTTSKALMASEASLQSLSARLLQVQDEERRRLARDLHDTTGQELSVVIMALDLLARQLTAPAGERRQMVLDSVQRLRKVESDVRTLSYVLHPPLLDEMGLASALGWFLDGYAKRTGIRVERDISARVPRFSVEKETALFRVIQECLTNVYRHSGSDSVCVRLSVHSHWIEASVQDRGQGFANETCNSAGKPKSGVGIQSMRGRLETVGGTFQISSDGDGTRVVATVPLVLSETFTSLEEAREDRDEGSSESADGISRRRVLIADDHLVTRRGIRTLFEGQPDLEICGEACDGVEALERVKELKPDVVILDLSMPKMGGLTVANHIREVGVPAKIIVFTSHSYPQLETSARAVGCDGYVMKSDAASDLVRAARAVLSGGKFYQTESAKVQSG